MFFKIIYCRIHNIIQYMIAKKSYDSSQTSPKVINIKISQQNSSAHLVKSKQVSHKIKKLPQFGVRRHNKTISLLENIDLFDLFVEKHDDQSPKKCNISSYLAYKQEQKLFRLRHNNKISSFKNKYTQHKSYKDMQQKKANQNNNSINDPKISNRIMSLITLGDSFSQAKDDQQTSIKPRIYIKTSEGKRQRIDSNIYMDKIKAKIIDTSDAKSVDIKSIVKTPENKIIEQLYTVKVSPVLPKCRPNILTNHIRARNIIKQKLIPNILLNQVQDFRPWTSNRSQIQD